jgi:DNA-binding NtrC family response regulator
VVNCAGLSDSLINSQLFGHKKGAFTDAVSDQKGFMEAADGGTILLDEIGDIPMNTQTRILRALEQKEIVRIGETTPRSVDVRILSATHKDLDEEVRKGAFRQDLLYRIRVARISLPPLRSRREDIPLIAGGLLDRLAHAFNRKPPAISEEATDLLLAHQWPGNVRELRNAIEFAMIRCKSGVIQPADLPPEIVQSKGTAGATHRKDRSADRKAILAALDASRGRRDQAAEALGVSRATLYRRMKACGLDPGRRT